MRKTSIFSLLALFLFFTVDAQVDRSQRPEPGPAPEIQLGEFESFELDNGLQVIVVENRQVPVVSFQLSLDLDPVFEGDAKGYVSLAGSLMREGTTNRSKQEIDEAIDFIGASLSTSSSGIFASSLTRHQDVLLDLMTDILYNPSFPEEELERLINQTRSGLATVQNDASAMASNVARAVTYGHDHPYGEITTEESLENVSLDLIRQYYEDHFKPNVAYLVIVGDMGVEEAREVTERYFASWEAGEVPQRTFPTPEPPEGRRVAFANRAGAVQSVVAVTHPVVLTPGHEDAIKVSVMNSVLGGGAFSGRLMQNLREDKGYTYGARSSLSTDPLVGRFQARTEVRNEVTDSTVTEILYEMERMINEPIDQESLELTRNFMTGSFARSLESPQTIARFARNVLRYDLPDDYYATYLERLAAVTVDDVQEMAAKYLKPENSIIVVAGNQDEVAETLIPFSATGEVEFYDAFGRPFVEAELAAAPEGYTAETVIERYIEAIGGRDQLKRIEDLTQKMTASLQGMQIQINNYQKAPHYMLVNTKMGDMVLSQQLFDGERFKVQSQMGLQEFSEGPEFEEMKLQAIMNMELHYDEFDIQTELLGVRPVNGRDAYKVELTYPSGNHVQDYYCVETGLKIKSADMQSKSYFSEYKEVNGLMFPHEVRQEAGGQQIDMQVDAVEINSGLEESFFVIE